MIVIYVQIQMFVDGVHPRKLVYQEAK